LPPEIADARGVAEEEDNPNAQPGPNDTLGNLQGGGIKGARSSIFHPGQSTIGF